MPFDAFFLTAVRRELEGSLTGCRIDKVQQPQRDTLILSMRGAAGGGRLRGIIGPVAGIITVEKGYETAIETALGFALQNIVVEDQGCARAATKE